MNGLTNFRVLLRVRMMYYIKHEVIGDYSSQIENGTHARLVERRLVQNEVLI